MKTVLGTLIVVSPVSARIVKLQLTPRAISILVLSSLLSLAGVVMFGYTFPRLVPDPEQTRIRVENQELRVKNLNDTIGKQQLENRVQELQRQSEQIETLIHTE